jgi:hypothetical protein
MRVSDDVNVVVRWEPLASNSEEGWDRLGCLYAYLAPTTPEILYVGKAWSVTVRGRWHRSAKEQFWGDLERERRIRTHRAIVGQIVLRPGQRLSHQLLCDIESLLIQQVGPWGNIQSRWSRIARPDLVVACRGAWPSRNRLFRDVATDTTSERKSLR